MNHSTRLTACAIGFLAVAPSLARAHAVLDHAIPAVGSIVGGSPAELSLDFSEGVVPALSGVSITATGGSAVPAGKPAADPGDPALLHIRLGRPLKPGTYVVKWHVVSVDTHPTSGSFKFTVSP